MVDSSCDTGGLLVDLVSAEGDLVHQSAVPVPASVATFAAFPHQETFAFGSLFVLGAGGEQDAIFLGVVDALPANRTSRPGRLSGIPPSSLGSRW